ncbi:MAG: AAA family ATPase [Deltaproteobacteria bacterium]|nr:AAA family ATPase [Deltaproteobacteria bacterium]
MSHTAALTDAAKVVREALADASRGLVDREALLELIALATVAREHVLVVGPPGTAKSEAVRRVAQATSGKYFEYLLGRFTEPSEIFGPVDLRKLKAGVVETETTGMLPEAEIAFLDEVFLGSTAILNTLLGLLNERVFRRGHTRVDCPLRVCVGATNHLPDDEQLAAFADRFLVRVYLDPIPDERLEELLEGGWTLASTKPAARASLVQLDLLAEAARRADMTTVRPQLAQAVRLLRRAGISLSDRRVVKVQQLVAAAGVLAGRAAPSEADLWPIVTAVPTREAQALARDVLRDLLARTDNAALSVAAAETSLGPLARARQVEEAARALFEAKPSSDDRQATEAWRLRLEGIARTIDAGFAADALPESLGALRARVVELLGAP